MSEMVERVARAIAEKLNQNSKLVITPLDVGRAAIEAMREPTDAMDRAAEIVGIDQDHRDYWAAMIDEALK